MSIPTWNNIELALKSKLIPTGLDLIQAFPIELYNSDEKCSHYPLPIPSSVHINNNSNLITNNTESTHLGILIGNTKAIWEPFLNHLSVNPNELCSSQHPIHDYVQSTIISTLESLPYHLEYDIRYPYDENDKFVYFQRLAHLIGFAYYNQSCYLCVSPTHGPWFALRAVIIFKNIIGPSLHIFHPINNPYPFEDDYLSQLTEEMSSEYKANYLKEGYKMDWGKLVFIRTIVGKFLPEEGKMQKYCHLHHYTKDRDVLFEALATRK